MCPKFSPDLLSVPKSRNRRKIAVFSNRKVLNRRYCRRNQKSQKNRQKIAEEIAEKIASDFLGRGTEIAAVSAFSNRSVFGTLSGFVPGTNPVKSLGQTQGRPKTNRTKEFSVYVPFSCLNYTSAPR